MSRITIQGIEIEYEFVGAASDPVIMLTPGGRFSKTVSGIEEFATALSKKGYRILLWDRPNCGASDICFDSESESALAADIMVALVRELKLSSVILAGGSAGSRISMMAAARAPALFSKMVLWWISGGNISLITLAAFYCCSSAIAASKGGMEAVIALPDWAEQLAMNPRNREILLRQDPQAFIKKMEQWALAYLPSENTPVPGMALEDFEQLTMPVRIYQNGSVDLSHTPETTDWVHRLIPNSELVSPPWPDDEWHQRSKVAAETGTGHFDRWILLTDEIVDFIEQ